MNLYDDGRGMLVSLGGRREKEEPHPSLLPSSFRRLPSPLLGKIE
jgi:hypothetical protein